MTTRTRLLIVTLFLSLTAAYLARTSRAEPVPTRESLASCPVNIADWSGRKAEDFDEETLTVLGVDEYLNRIYLNKGKPVGLYIGYYASQREGDTMHSPLNCLPGAGWGPVQKDRLTLEVPTRSRTNDQRRIEINRYVIQKGLDRQVVLYWYQSHGRVVASEYWGRIFMVLDAIRTNRTDGALVRVVAPIVTSQDDAERHAVDFVRVLFPLLDRYLPS